MMYTDASLVGNDATAEDVHAHEDSELWKGASENDFPTGVPLTELGS